MTRRTERGFFTRVRRAFLKSRFNNKGFTLIELIVSMAVLSIIMVAVTAVFLPMLQTFERANNLAEANTLLDNLSALIMDNMVNATDITPGQGSFTVTTSYYIRYYSDADGVLQLCAPGYNGPVLQKDFYKYKAGNTVFKIAADCNASDGVVTVTLTLTSDFGLTIVRDYTARPVGLLSF